MMTQGGGNLVPGGKGLPRSIIYNYALRARAMQCTLVSADVSIVTAASRPKFRSIHKTLLFLLLQLLVNIHSIQQATR